MKAKVLNLLEKVMFGFPIISAIISCILLMLASPLHGEESTKYITLAFIVLLSNFPVFLLVDSLITKLED
jgi:hypothetical protein